MKLRSFCNGNGAIATRQLIIKIINILNNSRFEIRLRDMKSNCNKGESNRLEGKLKIKEKTITKK